MVQEPAGQNQAAVGADEHFEPRLQAAGDGVAANLARPKGVQVWSESTDDRVTVLDYGDVGKGLRPVRIVAARNGSFCGQFIIGCDEPFRGVRVVPGRLKAVRGRESSRPGGSRPCMPCPISTSTGRRSGSTGSRPCRPPRCR